MLSSRCCSSALFFFGSGLQAISIWQITRVMWMVTCPVLLTPRAMNSESASRLARHCRRTHGIPELFNEPYVVAARYASRLCIGICMACARRIPPQVYCTYCQATASVARPPQLCGSEAVARVEHWSWVGLPHGQMPQALPFCCQGAAQADGRLLESSSGFLKIATKHLALRPKV